MSDKKRTLGDDVLAAFERACHEEDLQTAEYLLQALEALSRRGKSQAENMRQAYGELVRTLGNRPRQ